MCGISGMVSFLPIGDRLLQSILHLEYRGYDSCGIAVLNGNEIAVRKNVGSISEVEAKEQLSALDGYLGIAHTRWATHGRVTRENAHPHCSGKRDFAIVHNGVIHNHVELRQELLDEGFPLVSETDSEVVVHLVDRNFRECGDLEGSFVQAVQRLRGSYGIVLISSHDPHRMYCVKQESPLVIGLGEDTHYVGSDFNAFIDYTKRAIILEDGEYAVVERDGYVVRAVRSAALKQKSITEIDWDPQMSQKGGYPHFMLKEIHEEPMVVARAASLAEEEIGRVVERVQQYPRTLLMGVGTTYYVALWGQYLFTHLTGRSIPAHSSDEFLLQTPVDRHTLIIALSQSGETYDTLSALSEARREGAGIVGITNVIGSALHRMAEVTLLQAAGPEMCVLSTKAAFSQMVLLLRIALALARSEGTQPPEYLDRVEEALRQLPALLRQILNESSGHILQLAKECARVTNWLYLGRGPYYPIALEGALKLKEGAYLHAEGMSAGFLKHGSLALVEPSVQSVFLLPPAEESALFQATVSSLHEVQARAGRVVAFYCAEPEPRPWSAEWEIGLPPTHPVLVPMVHLLATQLFAYFMATVLKRNVDRPRSLAKSVTVP